jgi:hypothetical protein
MTKKADALECYRRAAEARDIANNTTDPITKADFLQLERRWRSLADAQLPAKDARKSNNPRQRQAHPNSYAERES